MSTLHMETDHIRSVVQFLNQKVLKLEEGFENLQSTSQRLAMAWQGNRSERFQRQFEGFLREYKRQIQELQTLARRLDREVQEWEEVDQNFGAFSRRMYQNLQATAPAGFAPASKPKSQSFNWFSPNSDAFKLLLKIGDAIPYRLWKGWGRWINQMAGNLKAGWVGKMDRLGHIVKSPVFQHGAPFALGVAEDLAGGDPWQRALGSEIIEIAVELAFPPLASYQTVLSVASVFSGVLELAGASEQALWLQNSIETVDIGDHIGDIGYDALFTRPARFNAGQTTLLEQE